MVVDFSTLIFYGGDMPPGKTLSLFRRQIDQIDQKILDLLNKRSRIVLKIGSLKTKEKRAYYVPSRERRHLDRLKKINKGPFPHHSLQSVFKEIFSASLSLQSPIKTGYLGPAGTFTHAASLRHFGHSTEMVPMTSISKVFEEVEHGRLDYGVVPIENSMEGVVNLTLDLFLDSPLKINAEILLPITHHLLSQATGLNLIQKIYSHPHATAQCRQWLEENLPSVPIMDESSTARAAQRAAEEPHAAAIASEYAAEIYNLRIVSKNIGDYPNNYTLLRVMTRHRCFFRSRMRPASCTRSWNPFQKRRSI